MKIFYIIHTCVCLVFLCSCSTEKPIHQQRPADIAMNRGAGRGDELLVTAHLENGRELLLIVDTGAPFCLFDTSLAPLLGKPLETAKSYSCYGKTTMTRYKAPKLYLGDTLLEMGDWVATCTDIQRVSGDLSQMTHTNRPIMGVLGMSCLKHYCIQLDFAAGKMRFLDSNAATKSDWGKAFPVTAINHGYAIIRENLTGVKGECSLIDTGCNFDGFLIPKLFRQWTNQTEMPERGQTRFPNGTLGGDNYPQLSLHGDGAFISGIGLSFLSRHLVTFDFPNRMLYLKRTSVGPLDDKEAKAAVNFLNALRDDGQLLGWSKLDKGEIDSPAYFICE